MKQLSLCVVVKLTNVKPMVAQVGADELSCMKDAGEDLRKFVK